jgi:hypothetical protein
VGVVVVRNDLEKKVLKRGALEQDELEEEVIQPLFQDPTKVKVKVIVNVDCLS